MTEFESFWLGIGLGLFVAVFLGSGCAMSSGVPRERCDIEWNEVDHACYVGWAAQHFAEERAAELGCDPLPPLYAAERIAESREIVDGGWAVTEYSRLSGADTCEELLFEPALFLEDPPMPIAGGR